MRVRFGRHGRTQRDLTHRARDRDDAERIAGWILRRRLSARRRLGSAYVLTAAEGDCQGLLQHWHAFGVPTVGPWSRGWRGGRTGDRRCRPWRCRCSRPDRLAGHGSRGRVDRPRRDGTAGAALARTAIRRRWRRGTAPSAARLTAVTAPGGTPSPPPPWRHRLVPVRADRHARRVVRHRRHPRQAPFLGLQRRQPAGPPVDAAKYQLANGWILIHLQSAPDSNRCSWKTRSWCRRWRRRCSALEAKTFGFDLDELFHGAEDRRKLGALRLLPLVQRDATRPKVFLRKLESCLPPAL